MRYHANAEQSQFTRRFLSRVALLFLSCAMSATAIAFDAAELMDMLSRIERSNVGFEETKYLAALTAPLVRRGTMHYVRPDRLEMRVDKPYFERLEIAGDKLTIETRNGSRQLNLSSQSSASAWVESMRATLAGDLSSLARHYRVRLDGEHAAWKLQLEPIDKGLAGVVERIEINGSEAQISRISIEERQGDRTVLVLSALSVPTR
jgi:hypothetical protein